MHYSCYQILALFCIYSFFGWCTEVIYHTVKTGEFVNRGFLNGPVCPIYGFGVLTVIVALEPLKDNLLVLFIGSVFLTSLIEFVTGFVLEKIFHDKWWDYSDEPFNIKGYICLRFSLLWGIACLLVVDIAHPLIFDFLKAVPLTLGKILLTISLVAFIVDFIVTVLRISKFKKSIRVLDELANNIKVISNEIGENISDGVLFAMEKEEAVRGNVDSVKETISSKIDVEKRKKELAKLKGKYNEFVEKQKIGYDRIFKAFPALQKGKYKSYIDKLKVRYKK
ncbi:MAG: putative ABC transporter permease [Clostridium sp.]|nr:putative ABC transporter permease [Clostridium sp.]